MVTRQDILRTNSVGATTIRTPVTQPSVITREKTSVMRDNLEVVHVVLKSIREGHITGFLLDTFHFSPLRSEVGQVGIEGRETPS